MSRMVIGFFVVLFSLPCAANAIPYSTMEHGAVPAREPLERNDVCHLQYYNICSGWTAYWLGYCYGSFHQAIAPPMYGTCFSLEDCPGQCRHLEDIWYSVRVFSSRAWVDIEVFCADEAACPVGEPIIGFYGVYPSFIDPWQHILVGGVPLCACDSGTVSKFVIIITDPLYGWELAPFSDLNPYNMVASCESQWRCSGHSYVYRNLVAYCDVYGAPAALWLSRPDQQYGCTDYPPVPPGCAGYWGQGGCFSEWLIDCYVSCNGPTATEDENWGGIKDMYR